MSNNYFTVEVKLRIPKSELSGYEYDEEDNDSLCRAVGGALNDIVNGTPEKRVDIDTFEIKE